MTMHSSLRMRITYVSGLLGSLSIAIGSLFAALVFVGADGERYSPLNHFVSELGEYGVSQGAGVFNFSLMFGGVFIIAFMVTLARDVNNLTGLIFGVLGAASGVFGAAAGVFTVNAPSLHQIVAIGFFGAGAVAVIVFTVYLIAAQQDFFPRWLLIPGVLTTISFIVFIVALVPNLLSEYPIAAPPDMLVRPEFWLVTALEWLVLVSLLVWIFCISAALVSADRQMVRAMRAAA